MNSGKSVAFITLGCKVNTSETEGMKRLFEKAGYTIADEEGFADVYIVNTCTVTNMGDRKSRQMLRRAHALNPEAVIAAVGCFAQVSPEEVAKIEGVSLVVGNNRKHEIVELVDKAQAEANGENGEVGESAAQKRAVPRGVAVGYPNAPSGIYVQKREELKAYEELPVETYSGHTRAFLKIQDGCDQFCAYCIIPYARGPIRSRGYEAILREAEGFAAKGFKEVVLTGIHLTSYGREEEGTDLMSLVEAVSRIDGIERIRLGSLEPMFITEAFVEKAKKLPKLCPHYHISLQSGSAATLKHMNRKYTPEDYRRIVAALKREIPDVAITTDVMVGFPGETDAEFEESLAFCEEMGFLWAHVFKYSPRQGTPAARFKDQVAPAVKEERSKRMIALAERSRNAFYNRFLGRTIEVLFEQRIPGREDMTEGLTANYMPVEVDSASAPLREIGRVCLGGIGKERLKGTVIKD